ncbi:hypothetical protein [Arcanobacterium hippocoleae]|uniref:Uncharacterized protein n=1 Tax=Arcanobacterium hippocoleae TaxID=149017 RepID=A0ABU1T2I1_9ACTO|nr:hypothetical protein [Arcanobacterium hippocoleae]MDR6939597.1 hypothetical protein [Arcanobacterium hippocoleae]
MAHAFESSNTSGSAWMGGSKHNPLKSKPASAWKMRTEAADDFLAGAVSQQKPAKAAHTSNNARTARVKQAKQQRPSRLVSAPQKQPFLTQLAESLKQDIAEAAREANKNNTTATGNSQTTPATPPPAQAPVPADSSLPQQLAAKNEKTYESFSELLKNLDRLQGEELTSAIKSTISANIGVVIAVIFVLFLIMF